MPNPSPARYVTGDNAPGFLPDVEPRGPWNSWADACRDLASLIEADAESRLDDADHETEGDERGDAQSYVRSQLEAARAEVETLREAANPHGFDVLFMGRAFFVRPADASPSTVTARPAPDRLGVTLGAVRAIFAHHNAALGLERDNGARVDLWHVLASLIEFCDAQSPRLDFDATLADVRAHFENERDT